MTEELNKKISRKMTLPSRDGEEEAEKIIDIKNLDAIQKRTRNHGEREDEIEIIDLKQSTKTRKFFRVFKYAGIFIVTALIVFSVQVSIPENGTATSSWLYRLPIIKQIANLVVSSDRQLKGEKDDRINILLLGMGGRTHEGGYLTDTLILASMEPSTKKVALVSIPRDLAVPVEEKGWQKINSINAYAEMEKAGSGGLAISQAVSDILEVPVDYYVRLDFEGFVNIVNHLGGIKIYVDNTLDDYQYPIMGEEENENYEARFEHLHIEKGWQTMDGDLALKYVRSRHGLGGEGSDFARARRQQKVLVAVKDKALSAKNLLKPKMITDIISELNEHVSTNLKVWEMIKLWDLFKDINKEDIANKVLDNSPSGLLADGRGMDGAYILVPQSGDFAEIQYFVNNVFSDAPREIKTKVVEEHSTVEIRNGTWINGLASQTSVDLEKYGFTVIRIGNSSRQNFQKSVIYDLTFGEKDKSLSILKEKTGANVSLGIPDWLALDIARDVAKEVNPVQPDFVLILGTDADKSSSGVENLELD